MESLAGYDNWKTEPDTNTEMEELWAKAINMTDLEIKLDLIDMEVLNGTEEEFDFDIRETWVDNKYWFDLRDV